MTTDTEVFNVYYRERSVDQNPSDNKYFDDFFFLK